MDKLKIRIVGGSLGGLFAAALLRQDGHDVRLYERSVSGLAGRGAGLVGQRDVFAILRAVGCERVAQVGVVAHERITLNQEGRIAHREASPQMQISWDHLYRTFRDMAEGDSYRLGRAVRSVDQSDAAARLIFEDGGEETADLVIGADGVGSVVREAVTGQPSPSLYAGYVAWRGLFPESLLSRETSEILLDRFAFFMMPRSHVLGYGVAGPEGEMEKGSRRYNWVWYRPVAADDLPAMLTDADGRAHPYSLAPGQLSEQRRRDLLADAARLLPQPLVDAVTAEARPFIQAIFDYETPLMARGRIALLGDAAFVVRPHTAMGVAKAAGDAMALRANLAQLPLDEALRAYDEQRLPLARSIAAYGRKLGAKLA